LLVAKKIPPDTAVFKGNFSVVRAGRVRKACGKAVGIGGELLAVNQADHKRPAIRFTKGRGFGVWVKFFCG
jgi:hypothetical protein